jgi:hypothetical protein
MDLVYNIVRIEAIRWPRSKADGGKSMDSSSRTQTPAHDQSAKTRPSHYFTAAAFILAMLLVVTLAYKKSHARFLEETVQNQLQIINIAFHHYAEQAKNERYPPVVPYPGVWAPDISLLFPQYIYNPEDLVNSALPNAQTLKKEMRDAVTCSNPNWEKAARLFAEGFSYTGYAIEDEDMFELWQAAWARSGRALRDENLTIDDETIYRLSKGVRRLMVTDINNPKASSSGYRFPVVVALMEKEPKVLYDDGLIGREYSDFRLRPSKTEEELRKAVAHELRHLALAMKIYCNYSKGGLFPPLAPYNGVWAPDISMLAPSVQDPECLVNSALPNARALKQEVREEFASSSPDWERLARIFSEGFIYTGYAIRDQHELDLWRNAWRNGGRAQRLENIEVDGATVHRLREGIFRFLITDVNNPAASSSAFRNPLMLARFKEGYLVFYDNGTVRLLDNEFFPLPGDVE